MVTAASLVAQVSVSGANQAKADLEGIGSTVNSVGSFLGNALVNGAVTAGKAIIGFGVQSVQAAADFQSSTETLVTGAGESASVVKDKMGNVVDGIDMVRQGILKMAVDTGTSTQQLTDGMYMIASAGYKGGAGLSVLQAAAEGAKVGNADLGTVASAVTGVMHDYADSHFTAVQATNALITTVSDGQTHMQDLGNSLAAVLPIASSLHIPFEQVAGAIATMTNAHVPAQQATQNLAFAIRALDVESSKGATALTNVGLSAEEVHNSLISKGLPATLEMIEHHIGTQFPLSSMKGQQALKDIMGGATGLNVALEIGGSHLKEFTGDIDSIGSSLRSKSKDLQGWSDVQDTFNFKLQQAQEAVEVLQIKIGTALLPILTQLLGQVAPLITQFTDWVTKNDIVGKSIDAVKMAITDAKNIIQGTIGVVQSVITWWNAWSPVIERVGTALLVFFLPAMIKAGVEAAISGAKIATSFIVSMIQTGAEAVVNAAKVTGSFVVSLIQTGVEGWASAGKLFTSIIPAFIATGAQAVANAAKVTGSFIASMIQTGVEAVVSAAKVTASFIASMIATGAQAVVTGAQIVASFVAGLISAAAEAVVSAGVMMATLVPALIAVAVEVIAATWPFLLIAAVVAAVVVGIVLAIQHWGAITAWFQGIWADFSAWFQATLQSIGNFFHSVWEGLISFFQSAWNTLVSIAKTAAMAVLAAIIGPFGLLIIYIIQHWQQILSETQSVWASITSTVSNAVNGIISFIGNAFSNLVSSAVSWGSDMISNFTNGITGAAGGLIAKAQSIASNIASILHFSKPDVGPLADADTWMPDMMDLLASGITSNLGKIKSASLNVAATIANPASQSSFASPSTGGGLQGLSVVPSSVSQGATPIQITVQPAPVMLDGRTLTNGLMPYVVNGIRAATGTKTY